MKIVSGKVGSWTETPSTYLIYTGSIIGRDDWIASPSANLWATPCRSAISDRNRGLRQTSDFYVPNVALYQVEPRPDSNWA